MFLGLFIAVSLLLQSRSPCLVSCSKRPYIAEDCPRLELTERSLLSFTRHLKSGPDDPLIIKLCKHFFKNTSCQYLCLEYLIGSAVIFGRVDEGALGIIRGLCQTGTISHLSDLVEELTRTNDCDAVARSVLNGILHKSCSGSFEDWIEGLITRNGSTMHVLVVKILTIWDGSTTQRKLCEHLLKQLPAKQWYRIVSNGKMPLRTINTVCSVKESDTLLREIFALARCSSWPNLELRKRMADEFPQFRQFLADTTIKSVVNPCPDNIPELYADLWSRVFVFTDVETLLFMLPLVCTLWRNLYPSALLHSTAVHDLYLQDLSRYKLSAICKVAPWRWCLPSKSDALSYLSTCIANGALDRATTTEPLVDQVTKYLAVVMKKETLLPKFNDCALRYASFLKLFEMVGTFCACNRPVLDRPEFFTDDEYERAVYYFVHEKKWILRLSESLAVDNMPRLFSIIGEDRQLMQGLVCRQVGGSARASITLVMLGQSNGLSEKLARTVLSRTAPFRRLIEPSYIDPSEYYNFIIESDLLPKIMEVGCETDKLHQLLLSLILFFKGDSEKINKIIISMIDWALNLGDWLTNPRLVVFKRGISMLLKDTSKYSLEDAKFISGIIATF